MKYSGGFLQYAIISGLLFFCSSINAENEIKENTPETKKAPSQPVHIEYIDATHPDAGVIEIPVVRVSVSGITRITAYRNESYQVVIHEIDRGTLQKLMVRLNPLARQIHVLPLELVSLSAVTTGNGSVVWINQS